MQNPPKPKPSGGGQTKLPVWVKGTFAFGVVLGTLFGWIITGFTDVDTSHIDVPVWFQLFRILICTFIFGIPLGLIFLSPVIMTMSIDFLLRLYQSRNSMNKKLESDEPSGSANHDDKNKTKKK